MKQALWIAAAITSLSCSNPDASGMKAITADQIGNNFETNSYLTIPVNINLEVLEQHIEAAIPTTLATIRDRPVCVEAQWIKTKVPYFKGWKLYSRMLKTKISPEIKCNVQGWVRRDGPVSLTAHGSQLRIAVPVRGKISAEVLKVSETAVAKAIVYFDITPRIDENWNLDLQISTDFSWSKRPTLKLFDIIKITIGSKVEPSLRTTLRDLELDTTRLANNWKLRDHMEDLWLEVQSPITLSNGPPISLWYSPLSAAYSGFEISDTWLNTSFVTTGIARVQLGELNTIPTPIPLPRLQTSEHTEDSFELNIPIILPYEAMTKVARSAYPEGHAVEVDELGTITLSDLVIEYSHNRKLKTSIRMSVDNRTPLLQTVDFFNIFSADEILTFEGVPQLDQEMQNLINKRLRVSFVKQ